MGSRMLAVVACCLVGMFGVVAFPADRADAHATLTVSDPPAGAVVEAMPGSVVLTFTEPIRAVGDKIRVVGPDGVRADLGTASVRGQELRIPLRPPGSRGTYIVGYRVISADNHPVAGGLTFSVGAPTENSAGLDAEGPATGLPLRIGMGVARYLGYAGLVLLVGPMLVLLLLWPRRLSTVGPARLALTGAALLFVGTVAELVVQVPYASGGGFSADAVGQVVASSYGVAHLVRIAVLAASVGVLRSVAAGRTGSWARVLLAVLAVAGALTWPVSGHPGASRAPIISVVADAVHLATMALWLGGLVMLAAFLLLKGSIRELRAILPIWSRWALTLVMTLAGTGAISALIEVDSIAALVDTGYGRLLLAKVGLLAVIVAVAASARRWVRTGYAGAAPPTDIQGADDAARDAADDGAARRGVRRGVLVEVGIAAVVIAAAAALVQTTPARTANATDSSPEPYSVTLTSRLYMLQVDLDPASTGLNTMHLYAYTPAGTPLKILEWRATAGLPSQGIEPVPIALAPLTDNHVTGQVPLPTTGTWELRFTLRTSDIDQASVTHQIPVR